MPHEGLDNLLALGTIALQIVTVAFLILYLVRRNYPDLNELAVSIGKWGLWIGLLASLAGSALTLLYSDVFGIPPCPLCWWQRIFLYPQVILFALALKKRDTSVALYSMILSIAGLGIAVYHHILQMYPSSFLPCPADGTVSCAQIFFLQFGYITYPMMAVTLFAFLFVLMLFVRKVPRVL